MDWVWSTVCPAMNAQSATSLVAHAPLTEMTETISFNDVGHIIGQYQSIVIKGIIIKIFIILDDNKQIKL